MYSAGRPADLHHHWESGCAAKCSPLTKQKNTTLQRVVVVVGGRGDGSGGGKKKKKKKSHVHCIKAIKPAWPK